VLLTETDGQDAVLLGQSPGDRPSRRAGRRP